MARVWNNPKLKPSGPKQKVIKAQVLSGELVSALNYRQPILINGKRGVVIEVNKRGDEIELVYALGHKKFSKDRSLILSMKDKTTPIQLYYRVQENSPAERLITEMVDPGHYSKGMLNAFQRQQGARKCPSCGFQVPRYPGSYPQRCLRCGEPLIKPEVV